MRMFRASPTRALYMRQAQPGHPAAGDQKDAQISEKVRCHWWLNEDARLVLLRLRPEV
jgi:hypothetical protein